MDRIEKRNNEGSSIKIGPRLLELLSKLGEIELEDVEIDAGELEIWIPPIFPTLQQTTIAPSAPPELGREMIAGFSKVEFEPLIQSYAGTIREVRIGRMKSEGGSRGKTLTIGGAKSPAFYLFEEIPKNRTAFSMDVFDIEVSLPKALKIHIKDVIGNPIEWARLAADKFGADAITVHLLSTDPLIKDATPAEASKTVEEILQAVDVPIIVGGCGDPKKDSEVFRRISETCHGERLMLSSVTLDMAEAGLLEDIAKSAREHDHVVLAFTAMDLNRAKELNRRLYDFLPEENIVMDLTTAALGYGLEYSFTIHERARLAALMGDSELQHPTLSGSTNAWAARESWLKIGPEWEPRELRGPLWETITALALLLAGVDMFMMMHPAAIQTVKEVINNLMDRNAVASEKLTDWVSIKL